MFRTEKEALEIIQRLNRDHGVSNYTVFITPRNKKKSSIASTNTTFKVFKYVSWWATHLKDEDFKRVILHEIAHALTPGHGHDPYFKRVCMSIGGSPRATQHYTYLDKIDMPEQLKRKVNYVYKCPCCGHKMETTRKLKRSYSCGVCSPRKYNEKYIMKLVA